MGRCLFCGRDLEELKTENEICKECHNLNLKHIQEKDHERVNYYNTITSLRRTVNSHNKIMAEKEREFDEYRKKFNTPCMMFVAGWMEFVIISWGKKFTIGDAILVYLGSLLLMAIAVGIGLAITDLLCNELPKKSFIKNNRIRNILYFAVATTIALLIACYI